MNAPCIDYKDTITVIFTTVDEYGADVPGDEVAMRGLVVVNSGQAHGANQDAITSDAQVYVDPSSPDLVANHYRLEGALVRLGLFGVPAADDWYRITRVDVARDLLLENEIDNVTLSLKKAGDIGYVS